MAKPGSQMGTKSRAVLECLSKNIHLSRLDLEMKLAMGLIGPVNNRLLGLGYIKQAIGLPGHYEITRTGRVALGEALEITTPLITRICNGTSMEVYNPSIHLSAHSGVARI